MGNMKINKFTLIELLVVVAVIGILTSLLLPALKKARAQSKIVVCKNNMKQINIAYQLYFDDNDDYYPTDEPNLGWDDKLNGYDGRQVAYNDLNTNGPIKKSQYNAGIYACPDDEITRFYGTNPDALTLSYSPTAYFFSIGQNKLSSSRRGITGRKWKGGLAGYYSSKVSEINKTSFTLSTFEYMTVGRCLGRNDQSYVDPEDFFASTENIPHEGFNKSNFLFVDGNVKTLNAYSTLSIDGGGMGSESDTTGTMWDAHK